MNTKGIVIYGPAACGKTSHAAALARHYDKTVIIDGGAFPEPGELSDHTLVLTNASTAALSHYPTVITFDQAMREAGITQP